MKRVLSVWMAAAKNLWWKLLLILIVMLAVEYGLYRWICPQLLEQGEHMARPFYAVMTRIHIKLVFFAAMAAVAACCCLQGSRFSGSNAYLLQRLSLPEWQITGLWALVHLGCFVILWAVQLLGVFGLWKLHLQLFPTTEPGLNLLVAFYENGFLHGLLPLADVTRWVYLAIYWLSMGILTAAFGYFQRRGRFRISLLVLLGCYFNLTSELGNASSNMIFIIACLLVVGTDLYAIWSERHEEEEN